MSTPSTTTMDEDEQNHDTGDRGNRTSASGGATEPHAVAPDEPAAHAVQAALADGLDRLRANVEGAGRGEVEGVHRARTSSRRLRSALRAFQGLVEADWADRLEAELKWIAGLLGAVRDLDVLKGRLRLSAGASVESLGPLFTSLTDRHTLASETLREALHGVRYRHLVEGLADAARRPALLDDARTACRSALPPLVADAWSRLKKCGRALTPTDPDEDYHEVRKRAKRARYTAEAVAPALGPDLGPDAERFARRATRVQDVLGEHQDAIVACREINRLVAERPHDGPFNLAAGRLLERQERDAAAARSQFFEVWEKLDRKKNLRWLKG